MGVSRPYLHLSRRTHLIKIRADINQITGIWWVKRSRNPPYLLKALVNFVKSVWCPSHVIWLLQAGLLRGGEELIVTVQPFPRVHLVLAPTWTFLDS